MSEEINKTENTQQSENTQNEPAVKTEEQPPASSAHDERPSGRPSHREDSQNDSRRDSRHRDNQDSGDRRQRFSRFKKKVCKFCHNKELPIDYKRPDILLRFLTDRGKILPRRITGTCAKHQRRMASEVKRSRMIALLPFVEQ